MLSWAVQNLRGQAGVCPDCGVHNIRERDPKVLAPHKLEAPNRTQLAERSNAAQGPGYPFVPRGTSVRRVASGRQAKRYGAYGLVPRPAETCNAAVWLWYV